MVSSILGTLVCVLLLFWIFYPPGFYAYKVPLLDLSLPIVQVLLFIGVGGIAATPIVFLFTLLPVYTKRIIIFTTLTFVISCFFVFTFIQEIIDFFPKPHIGQERIIGYAQYFGYPLFAEPVVVLGFLGIPLIIFAVASRNRLSKKRGSSTLV